MAGMPVGPLSLNDEVAVDLAWKIVKATEADLGPKAIDPRQKALLEEMVEKQRPARPQERQGLLRLSGERPEEAVAGARRAAAEEARPRQDRRSGAQGPRLLAMQALETARCFEEGVLTDVREADVGSILGFGFAPFSGGTLSYIDMMGTKTFVALCQRLEKKYGPRFAPPKLLLDMAQKGESFYGRFAPGKKAA